MPLARAPGAYSDIREVLDKVLLKENRSGRINCGSAGRAVNTRQRCYAFRMMEQRASVLIYPIGDPRHNSSAYDELTFTVVEHFVVIKPREELLLEDI